MDVVVCTHAIPSLVTLTQAKTKKKVQLEFDSYFDELMRIAMSLDFPISLDIMHKFFVFPSHIEDNDAHAFR